MGHYVDSASGLGFGESVPMKTDMPGVDEMSPSVGTMIGDPTGGVDFFIDRYGKRALEAIEGHVAEWWNGKESTRSQYNCDGPARPNPSDDKPYFTCLAPSGAVLSCPEGFNPEWVSVFHDGTGVADRPNDRNYERIYTSGVNLGRRVCMRVRAPTYKEAFDYNGGWRPEHSYDDRGFLKVKRMMIQTKAFQAAPKQRIVGASRQGRVYMELMTPTEGLIPTWPEYPGSPFYDRSSPDWPRHWHEMKRWNELRGKGKDLDFREAQIRMAERAAMIEARKADSLSANRNAQVKRTYRQETTSKKTDDSLDTWWYVLGGAAAVTTAVVVKRRMKRVH